MVAHVHHFEFIVTDSEFEALILECSLIKQYHPKYNILLKDDKGYHYIKITKGPWSRIEAAKQKLEDGATYIGPFISSWTNRLWMRRLKFLSFLFVIKNFRRIYVRRVLV